MDARQSALLPLRRFIFSIPFYESEAKLLVRYVLERRGVDPIDGANSCGCG
jgi:hypothetical protein